MTRKPIGITVPYRKTNMNKFEFQAPPNTIIFYNGGTACADNEVMRITKDGIIGNPKIPADEAALAILRALDGHIKQLIATAISEKNK